jgi:co-chaperonin GroES (HSP10)
MTTLRFKPVPPLCDLAPGIAALEFNVVVFPRELEEKTSGGIIVSEVQKERDDEAATDGVLVSVSPMAFAFSEWPKDLPHPEPGDVVIFKRYAGALVFGADGRRYRVMTDKDIMAKRTLMTDAVKPAF